VSHHIRPAIRDPESPLSYLREVDVSAFDVRANQPYTDLMADVHAFKTALQSSFDGWMQYANPCSFRCGAGDNGVELIADSRFQQHGRRGFADLPFHLLGGAQRLSYAGAKSARKQPLLAILLDRRVTWRSGRSLHRFIRRHTARLGHPR
jgi:hypothetical protein